MQPAAAVAKTQPQPQSQSDGQHAQRRHEAVQLAGHEQQTLTLGRAVGRHHGQIDEQARQIEQTGKPADDEEQVQGLEPQHVRIP